MVIQDAAACVVEKWTGEQVETKLARGYPGAVSGKVSSLWLWLPLCVLFLAPFIDPRRPLRLIHLDLLALLGFSVSLAFFNHAKVEASVGLVYPVLAYLFVRMLIAGFRPTDRRDRLLPVAPRGLLVAGIVALIAFHTAYMATEGKVIDVGLAGVVGADRLTHGEDVYGEGASSGMPIRGDVYGPVNYLAYVPFELGLPWSGRWDDVSAARAAALGFELLTALALFGLGRRLRPGGEGATLGVALAYAWLAYPFTMYTLGSSFNDGLVALLVVCCLLVADLRPRPRGAVRARRARQVRAADPGAALRRRQRRPAHSAARPLHGRFPRRSGGGDDPAASRRRLPRALRPLARLPGLARLAVQRLGAGAVAPRAADPQRSWLRSASRRRSSSCPRRRSTVQLAALGAALLIAVQVTANHWFYPYAVWFAPSS